MRIYRKYIHHCLLLAVLLCGAAHAEDIDIFAGTTTGSNGLPNVIFVLDNTSNWSRSSQKWPGGVDQGQSEVRAMKLALAPHVGKINIGIMEYVTGGSSADTDAGYTRFDLQPLTIASLGADNSTDRNTVNGVLNTIFSNINDPIEKRSSSNPYGDLPWDFYNYLNGGAHSNNGTGTPSLADSEAYTTDYSLFESPLEGEEDACADTYMIFIGNNANGAVAGDDATNSNALKAAYVAAGTTAPNALAGSTTGTPLGMPGFACEQTTSPGPLITPEIPEETETVPVPGASYAAQTGKALGTSLACYKTSAAAACTTAESARVGGPCNVSPGSPSSFAPVPTAGTCSCVAATTSSTSGCVTSGPPANRTYHLNITGNIAAYSDPDTTTTVVTQPYVPAVYGPDEITDVCEATDTVNTTTGRAYNFDDWAKFLHNYGIPLTVVKDGETFSERVQVSTFVIDVFNAQQSADLSSVWFSAADVGGGRYFQAKNEQQIIDAIEFAVGDILAVSSSFSAVTLPLSTTNSSQVENKIYIGMFRPAPGKEPRWFGNLKRYRLAKFFGQTELADVRLRRATNPLTGFATDCAQSFWTAESFTDQDHYWENLGIDPSPDSKCADAITANKQWSDLPDGPIVEKGGVAQLTREGPAGTARKLYTVKSGALELIDSSDATPLGGTTVLDYLRGDGPGIGEFMAQDGLGEDLGLRPSIHGDVVHSRPLSVRYDSDTALIFYGTNDGLFRAVDADSGAEQWAFLAPEHVAKVQRLHDNSPLVFYQGAQQEVGKSYDPKDYFFDGPTGQFVIYEDPDDPQSTALGDLDFAYIYPTMRRGGRMLYGFNVTVPDAPALMWRQGCPNLANDTGCTTGFSGIGQTWSMPVGAYVAEYPGDGEDPAPVVFVGGGFDDCLNADQAAYPAACSSAKGKGIYMLNAATGELIEYFATDAPVITDVVPIDIDRDKLFDFVYAADVAGGLYRIRFADLVADLTNLTAVPPGSIVPRDNSVGAKWVIEKIAALPDAQRRFYNSPALGLYRGTVFVTIGTGDRERPLEVNYPYAANVQNTFYVLADSPFADYAAEQQAIADSTTYTRRVVDLEGNTMYAVGTTPTDDQIDGWYLNLPDRGEQVANPAVVAGGQVFFNTFQPGGVGGGLCDKPLGIGTAYQVKLTGPQATEGVQLAAPGFPVAPIVANVEVPEGCTAEPCEPVETEDECTDPRTCTGEHVILGGCSDNGVCPIEPAPPPVRTRAYFTEEVDR